MQPLRILQVTPYHEKAWAYGGIPRVVAALTRELANRGHQITVCTSDAGDKRSRLQLDGSAPSTPGVEFEIFRNWSNRAAYGLQLFLPRGLHRYLARHAKDFDVGHLHACRNFPVTLAAHHLRGAAVPYLVTPNGTAGLIERRLLLKRIFDATFGRRFLAEASMVQAVTEVEKDQLRDLGVPAERVRVVGNPVDLAEFEDLPGRGRFRARLRLGEGPVILYLGRLSPRKRLDVLVDAFARLTETGAQLVIAGNDMGVASSLRSRVARLGLVEQVHWTGLLEADERLQALVDADVVVYPGQHEIFGLVPLEAMLCGRPVVVADDSGCAEVVRRAGGGEVVRAADASALTQACREMIEHPPSDAHTAAAAEQTRRLFGAPAIGQEIERVYGEVLDRYNRDPKR